MQKRVIITFLITTSFLILPEVYLFGQRGPQPNFEGERGGDLPEKYRLIVENNPFRPLGYEEPRGEVGYRLVGIVFNSIETKALHYSLPNDHLPDGRSIQTSFHRIKENAIGNSFSVFITSVPESGSLLGSIYTSLLKTQIQRMYLSSCEIVNLDGHMFSLSKRKRNPGLGVERIGEVLK